MLVLRNLTSFADSFLALILKSMIVHLKQQSPLEDSDHDALPRQYVNDTPTDIRQVLKLEDMQVLMCKDMVVTTCNIELHSAQQH